MLRSPIISVLGHVDHGKTSLLDAIRNSKVAKKEAGGITQMIGASYVSRDHINQIGKNILDKYKFNIEIPGLLFIDTPGHEAFSSLRDQGGSIADLAILVIDIKQGVQPQTIESINILKTYKTPFVIALTKVDTITGWKSKENIIDSVNYVKEEFNELFWKRVSELASLEINADLFYNIKDFTKTFAIVPVSSKTGDGIPELLVFIAALSQKFLKSSLVISPDEKTEATILDVKRQKTGNFLDIILYKGVLKKGDILYTKTFEGLKAIKVRGIFLPNVSLNNPNEKYKAIENVAAAAGVRIMVDDIEKILAGMPLSSSQDISLDVKDILKVDGVGIVVKVDSIGSAQAIKKLMNIPMSKLDIGPISKDDIDLAYANSKKSIEYGVVIGFNVDMANKEDIKYAEEKGVKIIISDIIYRLIENYNQTVQEIRNMQMKKLMENVNPCKIQILPYIFRKSKPAIVGIKVLEGTLKNNIQIMNDKGIVIGKIVGIQKNKQSINSAEKDDEVAISIDGGEYMENFKEGDILYSNISMEDLENWKNIISKDFYNELLRILIIRKKS